MLWPCRLLLCLLIGLLLKTYCQQEPLTSQSLFDSLLFLQKWRHATIASCWHQRALLCHAAQCSCRVRRTCCMPHGLDSSSWKRLQSRATRLCKGHGRAALTQVLAAWSCAFLFSMCCKAGHGLHTNRAHLSCQAFPVAVLVRVCWFTACVSLREYLLTPHAELLLCSVFCFCACE